MDTEQRTGAKGSRVPQRPRALGNLLILRSSSACLESSTGKWWNSEHSIVLCIRCGSKLDNAFAVGVMVQVSDILCCVDAPTI
jgi:hypothetical protein